MNVEPTDERRVYITSPVRRDLAGVDETFARQGAESIERYCPALDALAR